MTICKCVNVGMGDHTNAEALDLPPHMESYKQARISSGLSSQICVDRCIIPHIKDLWLRGIETLNSCCGHGVIYPSVCVHDDDILKMKEYGFQQMEKPYIFKLNPLPDVNKGDK